MDLAKNALQSAKNSLLQARADLARVASQIKVATDQIAYLGVPGGGSQITITAPISGEVEHRMEASVKPFRGVARSMTSSTQRWFGCCPTFTNSTFRRSKSVSRSWWWPMPIPTEPTGVNAFIHNEVDEKTRTTKVRVVVDNPGERLKQNMFVRVQSYGSGAQVTVPTSAVQRKDGLTFVFVEVMPGTYRRMIVQTGGTLGNRTILRGGLESGKKVVTELVPAGRDGRCEMIAAPLLALSLTQPVQVEGQIRTRYAAWDAAYQLDLDAIDRLLDSQFTLVTDHGTVVSRSTYLARLARELADALQDHCADCRAEGPARHRDNFGEVRLRRRSTFDPSVHRHLDLRGGHWRMLVSKTTGER